MINIRKLQRAGHVERIVKRALEGNNEGIRRDGLLRKRCEDPIVEIKKAQ